MSGKKNIIIIILVIVLFSIAGLGGFFIYQYQKGNNSNGIKENLITKDIKIEEKGNVLEDNKNEIKQLETKIKSEEEEKKNSEDYTKSETVQIGEYKLDEKAREGAITIKSASEKSINFSINVVNLYGGNHSGELSGIATKSGTKYVYTNTEYDQTYNLYIQVNENTIEVTTSKVLSGEGFGFDPFCGANAYFDGIYKR